ncbi:(ZYRO0E02200g) [Zygosaccharomyces parabailii]|nr:(ZYRO0E02200g) [Zygosaccharomyces parabailii]
MARDLHSYRNLHPPTECEMEDKDEHFVEKSEPLFQQVTHEELATTHTSSPSKEDADEEGDYSKLEKEADKEKDVSARGNKLAALPAERVAQMGREFAEQYELPNDDDIFGRAAMLARQPENYSQMDFLSEEERAACHAEATRPWTSMTRQLIGIICAAAMSAAVQGMDETVINGAMLFYPKVLGLGSGSKRDEWLEGLINGAPYLCCAGFSCWTTDWLNNRLGRKNVIFVTCAVSAITCFLQGFGPTGTRGWHYLFAFRFLLGLGIGPKSATTNVYLAECATKQIRGCTCIFWQFFTAFGIMWGYVFTLIFYRVKPNGIHGGLNWRLTLGSAMIPALLVMVQIPFCPESPRWLMGKGRYKEALENTIKIRPHRLLACRDLFYQHVLLMEEESLQLPFWIRLKEMFTIRRNRNGLLASCICAFMQQFCGINVIAYYSSSIFLDSGFTEISSLCASLGFGLINFFFAIPTFFMIDKHGRRYLLLRTFPWLALFLLIAGFAFWIPGAQARTGVVSMGIYVFSAIYSFSCGPVPFLIAAESANLASRSLNSSIFTVVLWGFNFILSVTWPSMRRAMTAQGAFGFYAFWNAMGFFMVYFCIPETKQYTLEELDEVFDVPLRTRIKYNWLEMWPNFQYHVLRRKNVMRRAPLGPQLPSLSDWEDKPEQEHVERAASLSSDRSDSDTSEVEHEVSGYGRDI